MTFDRFHFEFYFEKMYSHTSYSSCKFQINRLCESRIQQQCGISEKRKLPILRYSTNYSYRTRQNYHRKSRTIIRCRVALTCSHNSMQLAQRQTMLMHFCFHQAANENIRFISAVFIANANATQIFQFLRPPCLSCILGG